MIIIPTSHLRHSFRVGVTGARRIERAAIHETKKNINIPLSEICNFINSHRDIFKTSPCLLSPLAEGADRLVAKAALQQNFDVQFISPFKIEEYRKDFFSPATPGLSAEDCLREFDDLLTQVSSVIELEGDRLEEAASYEAVGRAVVHRSDLMIAVWNGLPGAGRGGTADTIHFALDQNVPVWWVRLPPGEAVWLTEISTKFAPYNMDKNNKAIFKLREYLQNFLPKRENGD